MIETYDDILVLREDMFSIGEGSPPFSKMRGIYERLKSLKLEGYENIGYTESNISMAGWGVAYCCKKLGLNAIIFDPIYVHDVYPGSEVHKYHRERWKELGAEIINNKAGMVKVNFNISKRYLLANYNNSIMLPLGLPFEETINETGKVLRTISEIYNTIVVCVGSGTICAGILKALPEFKVLHGVLTRQGSICHKYDVIYKKAGLVKDGLFRSNRYFILRDLGWKYSEKSEYPCPFPCHDYYDRKAWQWLKINENNLIKPILFWNIGRNAL